MEARSADISWFWPLDPWLNLLAGFRVGLEPGCGDPARLAVLATLSRFEIPRRLLALIVGAALLYSSRAGSTRWRSNPKSRMFFVSPPPATLAIGSYFTSRAWRGDGRLGCPGHIAAVIIPFASLIVAIQSQTRSSERAAAAWIRQFPGRSKSTRRHEIICCW